jgi:hypothetical protein
LQTESPSTRPEQKKEEWEDKMDLLEKDFKTASIPTQEHIQSLMDLKTDEKAIKDIDKRRIFEDRRSPPSIAISCCFSTWAKIVRIFKMKSRIIKI